MLVLFRFSWLFGGHVSTALAVRLADEHELHVLLGSAPWLDRAERCYTEGGGTVHVYDFGRDADEVYRRLRAHGVTLTEGVTERTLPVTVL